jgi:hypothetical protein
VLDKAALGQVFSEYYGFSANSHSADSSTLIITITIIICHPGLVQYTK